MTQLSVSLVDISTPHFYRSCLPDRIVQEVSGCRQVAHVEKQCWVPVLANEGGAVDLQMTDHRLDAGALAVDPLIPADCHLTVQVRRDRGENAGFRESGANSD